jgi:DNA-binding SARP family transcriptional activator
MYFGVLGSLEVNASGERILITAPKQRAVLVSLLLNANTDVPVDRLTVYVWDGQPPTAAQTTLQSYIYRLRQLLRPMAGVELQTSAASYMLQVDPSETDIWSFKQRVCEARDQILSGNLHESVRSLRKALALWRGSALAGIPGKLIQQEARFLEDERIAAYEDLFSAEIALGNHRKIVPELKKIMSVHQFHEMLGAQLMLALYRSGRQAEALQVYTVIRRRLRDDLGIEPGPELQNLHKAILEQVPSMTIMLPTFGGVALEGADARRQ